MRRKNIKNKIKEHFLTNPTDKLRVRQIERKLNLPLPSIINHTKKLSKENILQKIIISNITLFTANRTSDEYKLEKKLFNIRKIYESNLIKYLKKELSNPTIILFGSYLKAEDIEDSDIDLYIETESKKQVKLKKFEKKLNRKIQIFRYKNIREIKNKFLANNILNGLTLNKFIEVL
jgi:predicted nucleotidyltransferase